MHEVFRADFFLERWRFEPRFLDSVEVHAILVLMNFNCNRWHWQSELAGEVDAEPQIQRRLRLSCLQLKPMSREIVRRTHFFDGEFIRSI